MRSLVATVGLALALTFAPAASAQPRITAPVTDLADAVPAEQEQQLTAKLTGFRLSSGVAVAVLVVPTTGSTALEAYAMRVATAWRQELPGATSAVLYVLAVNDRRHRLEVNNAARVRLPDARAQELLDAARPSLRSADHGGAVRLVMDGVLTALAPAPAGTVETITEAPSAPPPAPTVAPAPAPTVAAPATSQSEGSVCFGLFCLGAFLLGLGLLVSLVVAGVAKAGRAISQGFSGTTYGHDGASHDPGSAWLHGGAHDTSSWSSSDASSSAWSASDASSSSSSDTSSGSGGDFSGGGASSDW
jgi:uncharacterized protein